MFDLTFKLHFSPFSSFKSCIFKYLTKKTYLQSIQNQTIRLIFKMKLETNSEELHSMSKLKSVSERFNQLNLRYIEESSESNPLLVQLIKEYTESINSIIKTDYQSTPLTYIKNLQMKNFENELFL